MEKRLFESLKPRGRQRAHAAPPDIRHGFEGVASSADVLAATEIATTTSLDSLAVTVVFIGHAKFIV